MSIGPPGQRTGRNEWEKAWKHGLLLLILIEHMATWEFCYHVFLVQRFIKFPYDVGVSDHQRKIEKSKKIPTGVFLVFYRLFSHLYFLITVYKF